MSKRFRNDTFVVWALLWRLKWDAFQKRTIFMIQTHPSKVIQKYMLKAWDFTKNKLCHRYFDNKLQKISQTNILDNGTRQILLIVALMVGLWLQFQMEIVD